MSVVETPNAGAIRLPQSYFGTACGGIETLSGSTLSTQTGRQHSVTIDNTFPRLPLIINERYFVPPIERRKFWLAPGVTNFQWRIGTEYSRWPLGFSFDPRMRPWEMPYVVDDPDENDGPFWYDQNVALHPIRLSNPQTSDPTAGRAADYDIYWYCRGIAKVFSPVARDQRSIITGVSLTVDARLPETAVSTGVGTGWMVLAEYWPFLNGAGPSSVPPSERRDIIYAGTTGVENVAMDLPGADAIYVIYGSLGSFPQIDVSPNLQPIPASAWGIRVSGSVRMVNLPDETRAFQGSVGAGAGGYRGTSWAI